MQEVLPHFASRHAGHVIDISSRLGRMPFALIRSAYGASKHILNTLTANLRTDRETERMTASSSITTGSASSLEGSIELQHGVQSTQFWSKSCL